TSSTRAPTVSTSLAALLRRRAWGSRFGGTGRWPLEVAGSFASGAWPFGCVGLVAGRGATLAGCDVIEPHSSLIERHQLQVSIQLQAEVEVVNPVGQQQVLGL